jgi:single-stranded DNA-specific DHH superfamily exonuclease
MVKAEDMRKEQNERNEKKQKIFKKIYKTIEKKISVANSINDYYILYEIPEFILGLPPYSLDTASKYLKHKLKKNGFKVEYYLPNKLLIEWFPSK